MHAKKQPQGTRERDLKHKYGITEDDYNSMLASQGGKCGICQRYRRLVVDHCHTTNKVRGLLCSHCNSALGFFEDNEGSLTRAVEYINGAK